MGEERLPWCIFMPRIPWTRDWDLDPYGPFWIRLLDLLGWGSFLTLRIDLGPGSLIFLDQSPFLDQEFGAWPKVQDLSPSWARLLDLLGLGSFLDQNHSSGLGLDSFLDQELEPVFFMDHSHSRVLLGPGSWIFLDQGFESWTRVRLESFPGPSWTGYLNYHPRCSSTRIISMILIEPGSWTFLDKGVSWTRIIHRSILDLGLEPWTNILDCLGPESFSGQSNSQSFLE